jgi:DNA replication protein DnaC
MSELLEGSLRSLGLKGMLEAYEEVGEAARRESMSYEKYLEELVERERQERSERRVQRLRRQSRLPPEKTLESFDRGRLTPKLNAQLSRLLEGEFLHRSENVLAFGNPGSGKSHLLCALGHEVVSGGHAVLFQPCSLLVQDLLRAKRDLDLAKALKKLRHFEVLLIDDIGYVQQSREEMEVLFGLLADRYERGSVMVTSNLAFSDWEKIFREAKSAECHAIGPAATGNDN